MKHHDNLWPCFCQWHFLRALLKLFMMMLSNGNFFRVTGPLCGELTSHQWILLTKASDAELWCFLWSAPWINGWVNNPEAGDWRCHRTHYDICVMSSINFSTASFILFHISMGSCKEDVTPLLVHCSYLFLVLAHRITMNKKVSTIQHQK